MNLSNREELIAAMQQAAQPSPEQAQAAQALQQAQLAFQQSQTEALSAQAKESSARAVKLAVEANAVPQELEIDRINAITRNLKEGDAEDKEFERRMKVANTLLKKREIEGKENANGQRTTETTQPNRQELPRQMEPLRSVGTEAPRPDQT
tara:strand:- start:16 stop:468 length:453 start_codon:yes stop_codon:yes gene_type:complete